MSRKGNCYDNAPVESFFGTLKTELVHHRHYQTREEAARDQRVHRPLLQPAAAASASRLPVAGCLHATVHAAAKGGVSVRHGVHY